jgi:hypothetical protein
VQLSKEDLETYLTMRPPRGDEVIWAVSHSFLYLPGDDGEVEIKAYSFCTYHATDCLDAKSGGGNGFW